jgi:hypothetical protein
VFASELRRCAAPWDEQWRALAVDGRLGGEVAGRARALAKDLARLNNNLSLDAEAKVGTDKNKGLGRPAALHIHLNLPQRLSSHVARRA